MELGRTLDSLQEREAFDDSPEPEGRRRIFEGRIEELIF
jgi:hypothetical protein